MGCSNGVLHIQIFFFEILLNQPEIWFYLPSFSDWFGSKRTSIWTQINRKMVNTIWFRDDLIRFWKQMSLCVIRLADYASSYQLAPTFLPHMTTKNITPRFIQPIYCKKSTGKSIIARKLIATLTSTSREQTRTWFKTLPSNTREPVGFSFNPKASGAFGVIRWIHPQKQGLRGAEPPHTKYF